MRELQPKLKDISLIKPDAYFDNLTKSNLQDAAILPSGGSGYYLRRKNDGEILDEGGYNDIDFYKPIEERLELRKNINIETDLTEAKLPRPVVVSEYTAVRNQPAINMADVTKPMLQDLSFEQQENVLGDNITDRSMRKENILYEKIQNIIQQPPLLIQNNITDQQVLRYLADDPEFTQKLKKKKRRI